MTPYNSDGIPKNLEHLTHEQIMEMMPPEYSSFVEAIVNACILEGRSFTDTCQFAGKVTYCMLSQQQDPEVLAFYRKEWEQGGVAYFLTRCILRAIQSKEEISGVGDQGI